MGKMPSSLVEGVRIEAFQVLAGRLLQLFQQCLLGYFNGMLLFVGEHGVVLVLAPA